MRSDGILKAELRLTQKSQASLPVCLASPLASIDGSWGICAEPPRPPQSTAKSPLKAPGRSAEVSGLRISSGWCQSWKWSSGFLPKEACAHLPQDTACALASFAIGHNGLLEREALQVEDQKRSCVRGEKHLPTHPSFLCPGLPTPCFLPRCRWWWFPLKKHVSGNTYKITNY